MSSGAARRKAERQAAQRRIEARIDQLIEAVSPGLAARRPGEGLSAGQLAEILSRAESNGLLNQVKRFRRAIRSKLLELKQATGGQVAIPAPEVVLARTPSPFRPDKFEGIPALSRMVEAFLQRLAPGLGERDLAAQILFSSIVFGGLLHPVLVEALPSAIEKGFHVHDGECWLEIPIPSESDPGSAVTRRWFPDSITVCLIANWRRRGCPWPAFKRDSTKALLAPLLRTLSAAAQVEGIESRGQLVQAAETRLRLSLPGVLVDFLASVNHGVSLPASVWWRLHGRWICAQATTAPSSEAIADELCRRAEPPDFRPAIGGLDSSGDLRALMGLKRALKDGEKFHKPIAGERSVEAFRNSPGARGPMLAAIIDWALWMLKPMATGHRRARPQSVYRYLNWFAKPLIALAGEIDPVQASAELVSRTYDEVLESIRSSKARARAAGLLRDLHSFLVMTRDASPTVIDGVLSERAAVRANIVAEREYRRALGLLHELVPDARTVALLRVFLILGYRLGPRRNELAHVQLKDLQGLKGPRPLLWIHSHRDASLKTSSSVRRLPLFHLLEPDELEELRAWEARRRQECGLAAPASALLFCEPGKDTQRIEDASIDLVVAALRQACEDPAIVLHTLRHSFLSHLFLHLLLAGAEARFGAVISPHWLPRRMKDVLRHLFQATQLPREAMYVVSAFAGHLDPNETLTTYIHFQDWIACVYLRAQDESIPLEVWAKLEGISVQALMVRRSRHKGASGASIPRIDTRERLLRELAPPLPEGRPVSDQPARPEPRQPAAAIRALPLEGIYCVLALANKGMSHKAREHVTGLPHEVFAALHSAARQLASVKTGHRGKHLRRPRLLMPLKAPRRRPAQQHLPQLDGLSPAMPRERSERIDARSVFAVASKPDFALRTDQLVDLLGRTSHSDPVVVVRRMEELEMALTVLSALKISRDRTRIEIRSWPRGLENRDQWIGALAAATRLPIDRIGLASESPPETTSARTHPAGLLVIRIESQARILPASGPEDADESLPRPKHRLSYGWRVGLYYAVCVRLAA